MEQNYAVFTNEDVPNLNRALAGVPEVLKLYHVTSRADYLNRARATMYAPSYSYAFVMRSLLDRIAAAPAWYWETLAGLPLEQPVDDAVTG